ncbi:MAG: hypothetical protein ACTMIR_11945 [Cellulomonadaceae bacterium]
MTDDDVLVMPMLGRGRHRSARRGACFMELASYLAGERWSDRPRCTHPLVAMLARAVNDFTSDAARPRLAPWIPAVIGLTSADPRVDVHVALRCAQAALPVARESRQLGLAVAICSGEAMLDSLDARPPGTMSRHSQAALDAVPRTALRAREFVGMTNPQVRGWVRHAAPGTVALATRGIAEAVGVDPDARLRSLLVTVVEDLRSGAGLETAPALEPRLWDGLVRAAM